MRYLIFINKNLINNQILTVKIYYGKALPLLNNGLSYLLLKTKQLIVEREILDLYAKKESIHNYYYF